MPPAFLEPSCVTPGTLILLVARCNARPSAPPGKTGGLEVVSLRVSANTKYLERLKVPSSATNLTSACSKSPHSNLHHHDTGTYWYGVGTRLVRLQWLPLRSRRRQLVRCEYRQYFVAALRPKTQDLYVGTVFAALL